MKTCHIFAGGVIENPDFIGISSGDLVICADSGMKHARSLGIIPDIIVGDFDSYSDEFPDSADVLRSIPEKDDTDTMLAVKTAIEKGARQIMIYGAFGGRFDHTFANIQTLKYASEHGCEAVLADSANFVMLQSAGERRYKRLEGWYFAFFAYSESLLVRKLSGVKYPLENTVVTNSFPIGVSNEFADGEAVLDIEKGTALVIFSKM